MPRLPSPVPAGGPHPARRRLLEQRGAPHRVLAGVVIVVSWVATVCAFVADVW